MGARLLRQCILQPLNDLPTINLRLDALDELLSKEQMFFDLTVTLPQFPDLDVTFSHFAQIPNKHSLASGRLVLVLHFLCINLLFWHEQLNMLS